MKEISIISLAGKNTAIVGVELDSTQSAGRSNGSRLDLQHQCQMGCESCSAGEFCRDLQKLFLSQPLLNCTPSLDNGGYSQEDGLLFPVCIHKFIASASQRLQTSCCMPRSCSLYCGTTVAMYNVPTCSIGDIFTSAVSGFHFSAKEVNGAARVATCSQAAAAVCQQRCKGVAKFDLVWERASLALLS